MNSFIKEKIDLNFYDSSCPPQLQKLKYLFKLRELSSLNSIGKYLKVSKVEIGYPNFITITCFVYNLYLC